VSPATHRGAPYKTSRQEFADRCNQSPESIITLKDSRLWLWALAAAVLMQTISAFLTRIFPVMGPVLTEAASIPPEYIGYLAALSSLGTIWYLVAGGDLLAKLGPLRSLQLGALVGLLGLLLALAGTWWALMLAAFLIGFGYGPSPTAGSEVLNQFSPTRHRSLVFSIKQAGVPLGGAIAGIFIPALLAFSSWRVACVASALLVLAITVMVEPLRTAIDRDRDPRRKFRLSYLLDPSMLRAPFRALSSNRPLLLSTVASACFAIVQGCVLAFFVTFLTVQIGIGLAAAGVAFSIMQVAGVAGRVIAGWTADRAHSPRMVLIALGVASSIVVALMAAFSTSWPAWTIHAIAAVAGVAATGWNGVFMAEITQLAPRGRIGEITAAATFFTFCGYVVGPAAFGGFLSQGTSYASAFAMLAVVPLCGVIALALAAACDRPPASSGT
jgi:MFS family permease